MRDLEIAKFSESYHFKIWEAFDRHPMSMDAVKALAKSLVTLYRYFEPAFFNGKLYVYKHLNDELCFDKDAAIPLYDKNILLDRRDGVLILQVFSDESLFMWNEDEIKMNTSNENVLLYEYSKNQDIFHANGVTINGSVYNKGSQFAPQFTELAEALSSYSKNFVLHSSCPLLTEAWHDKKRLFFKSEGSGNNVPEKHMQASLYHYLKTVSSIRGVNIEISREFNVKSDKPKPVDIRVQWREANRMALIEIKWIGMSINVSTQRPSSHGISRVNQGYEQLKGYYDSAKSDYPTSILSAILVIFDARRQNLTSNTKEVSREEGLFYEYEEVNIDSDKQYYSTTPGFERPIKFFTAPICK